MRVSWAAAVAAGLWLLCAIQASSSGTETLIGLCGKDFVLLAADAVANGDSGSPFLTSSNRDKIHVVSDTMCDATTTMTRRVESPGVVVTADRQQQQQQPAQYAFPLPTAVAVAGDTADADRLVGLLRAEYNLAHYENLADSDVLYVNCDDPLTTSNKTSKHRAYGRQHSSSWGLPSAIGMNVHSVAQLARHYIAETSRGNSPFRVCLLVAGLVKAVPVPMEPPSQRKTDRSNCAPSSFSVARHVQQQVSQATASLLASSKSTQEGATIELTGGNEPNVDKASSLDQKSLHATSCSNGLEKPVLYWIDEYGALQRVSYGVHGMASHMLWSVLDQGYRDDMTLEQGMALLRECLAQLRTRYALNTQPQFFVKCLDASGCRVIDLTPLSRDNWSSDDETSTGSTL
jgi:20S proteasome alpha/beta subunit